jgi:hypothetical protein
MCREHVRIGPNDNRAVSAAARPQHSKRSRLRNQRFLGPITAKSCGSALDSFPGIDFWCSRPGRQNENPWPGAVQDARCFGVLVVLGVLHISPRVRTARAMSLWINLLYFSEVSRHMAHIWSVPSHFGCSPVFLHVVHRRSCSLVLWVSRRCRPLWAVDIIDVVVAEAP